MKSKILKLVIIVLITTLTIAVTVSPVLGANAIDTVIGVDKNVNIKDNVDKVRGNALGVAQVIGVSVAVIMLVVIAIKYMVSAPQDKADVKKQIVPFLVGAIMIFASVGIIQIIKTFATQNFIK